LHFLYVFCYVIFLIIACKDSYFYQKTIFFDEKNSVCGGQNVVWENNIWVGDGFFSSFLLNFIQWDVFLDFLLS